MYPSLFFTYKNENCTIASVLENSDNPRLIIVHCRNLIVFLIQFMCTT
jgi:hypothetical protein